MPFATTLEVDNENGQLFMIGIDDVDRDSDRLVLAFKKDGEVGELAFALMDHESGARLLQLDKENCSGYAVDDLDGVLRQVDLFGKLDKDEVYLVTEDFSTKDLTLSLPPTIALALVNHKFLAIDVACELKIEDGETVTVESRTLG